MQTTFKPMHHEELDVKDIWLALVYAAAEIARLDQDITIHHETLFSRASPTLLEFHTSLVLHPVYLLWALQSLARCMRRKDHYPMAYVTVTLHSHEMAVVTMYRGGPWKSDASLSIPAKSPAKRYIARDASIITPSISPASTTPLNSSSYSPLLTPPTTLGIVTCEVENKYPVTPSLISMALLNAIACLAPLSLTLPIRERWQYRDSVTQMTVTFQPITSPLLTKGVAVAALECVASYMYHANRYEAVRFTLTEEVRGQAIPVVTGEIKGGRPRGGR